MGEGKTSILQDAGYDTRHVGGSGRSMEFYRRSVSAGHGTMRAATSWEYFVSAMVGIPIGLLLFWTLKLWMVPIPIEFYTRGAEPEIVTAGDQVLVQWTAVRTDECRSVVYRTLIGPDGRLVLFEPQYIAAKPLGPEIGEYMFNIPNFGVPGPMHYRVKTEFFCNWVQEIFGGSVLPLSDIEFKYTTAKGRS